MTRFRVPLLETATNNPNSADQTTLFHVLSAAEVRVVQVVPLDDVITRLPVPVCETATNRPNSADQHTLDQLLATVVLVVQVVPFGDVITPLVFPLIETATNKDNSGDQHTSFQVLLAVVLVVQLIPSGDVIALPVPVCPTATNNPISALQTIPLQLLSDIGPRVVQVDTVLLALAREVLKRLFNVRILIWVKLPAVPLIILPLV